MPVSNSRKGRATRQAPRSSAQDSSQKWQELQTWRGICHAHLGPSTDNDSITTASTTSLGQQHVPITQFIQAGDDSISFTTLANGIDNVRFRRVPPYQICLATFTITNARASQRPRQRRFAYKTPIRLLCNHESGYTQFYDEMLNFVNEQRPCHNRSYFQIAHVRLMQWNGDKFEQADCCDIERRDDWVRKVPYMVATYCSLETRRPLPFYLDINSEFETFTLESCTTDTIIEILDDTVLKNFAMESYWSKKFLKQLFDQDTVTKVVESHIASRGRQLRSKSKGQAQSLTRANSSQFVEWILPDRIRLFGTTIRSRVGIDQLHDLMLQGSDDIKDNNIPLDDKLLNTFLRTSGDVDLFKAGQRGFRPYNFPDPEPDPEDGHIEDYANKVDQLIPMYYDEAKPIGSGGFGRVYRAQIHPEFHAFSSDRNQEFAVKVISDSIYHPSSNEVKAWRLAVKIPHPHITPLHTSWLQENQCFMLSPLATTNLRDFLNSGQPFKLEQHTEWLLEQFDGLASGLHHIHHIGRILLREPAKLKRLGWFDCGYHHDLKPENVLIFHHAVWKIGDFGTAKIRKLVSGPAQELSLNTDSYPAGASEFGGPDRFWEPAPDKRVGQPYDIWSLGCILFEVLLWVFGRGGKYLKDFQDARSRDPCDECECSKLDSVDDKIRYHNPSSGPSTLGGGREFWFKCTRGNKGLGRFHLKPCVRHNLDWLKQKAADVERAKRNPLFSHLCECIEEMLQVNPKDRPTVSQVLERVGDLRFRANFHFRQKDSAIDAEIVTMPGTIDAASRYPTPNPTEVQAHRDADQETLPATRSRKRKADQDDEPEQVPLPSPSGDVQYMGGHLDHLALPGNTRELSVESASQDDGQPNPARRRLSRGPPFVDEQPLTIDVPPTPGMASSIHSDQMASQQESSVGRSSSRHHKAAVASISKRLTKESDDPSLAVKMAERVNTA